MRQIFTLIVLGITLFSVGAVSGQAGKVKDAADESRTSPPGPLSVYREGEQKARLIDMKTNSAAVVLKVVATTTIVADVAQQVGGDFVEVVALVPADADSHAFQPAPQDVVIVAEADVVLAVGANYEVFLGGLMENAANVPLATVSIGVEMYPLLGDAAEASIEALGKLGDEGVCEAEHRDEAQTTEMTATEEPHAHGSCDPHVWTDPQNGMIWADNIAAAFAEVDPNHAEVYKANAQAYQKQLEAVDVEIEQILSVVSDERRILVTNHEFMNYFARAYSFRVAGVVIPGGTSGGESDPQQLARLIETVKELGVPVMFAETTANTQVIDSLAEEAGVQVVSTLSESLTEAGDAAPTYIDYLRYNARTIAGALGAVNG